MTFGRHKRSLLTFDLSAKVALIGLQIYFFQKSEGQLKSNHVESMLWISNFNMAIKFMSCHQDVFMPYVR